MLNAVIMSGQHMFLNLIASGLLLAVSNILLVDLQVKCSNTHCPNTAISRELKIVIYCIIVVIFIIGITVCAYIFFAPSDSIPDNNGSQNTNLAVITTSEIITTTNHYSAFKSSSSQKGEHSNVSDRLKDYDYDEVMFSSEKVSGVKTLQATKTAHNELTLEIDSRLEIGNMEIVILIENEYYGSVPINESHTITLNDVADKTVVVKLAAESAKINISIKRSSTGDGLREP